MELTRYGIIDNKNKREIVLLRGSGCKWKRCRFCNYHLDKSSNYAENHAVNLKALSQITGKFGKLEVINSGSFSDLDEKTIDKILNICKSKGVNTIHFESHWIDRHEALKYKALFEKELITVKIKTGVETFDYEYREKLLCKGISTEKAEEIAIFFDECCLLFGLSGQTEQSMLKDIEIGLLHFERVCINIMEENGMPIKPDFGVIKLFNEKIMPQYINNPRVDILLSNTDFGVGAKENINAK